MNTKTQAKQRPDWWINSATGNICDDYGKVGNDRIFAEFNRLDAINAELLEGAKFALKHLKVCNDTESETAQYGSRAIWILEAVIKKAQGR